MRNPKQFFRGKHKDLCIAIAQDKKEEAFSLIYAFFRSEENTDSYSIALLTMVREFLEANDSEEMYKMRVRFRSNGDRVLINLVQFLYAMQWSGSMSEGEEILEQKILAELPKLARSMQMYADEEGVSPSSQMQALRIREALRMLAEYYEDKGDEDSMLEAYAQKLAMTRILLFHLPHYVSEDLLQLANAHKKLGDSDAHRLTLREIVELYDDNIEIAEQLKDELPKELEELTVNLRSAYEELNKIDGNEIYEQRLVIIESILKPAGV